MPPTPPNGPQPARTSAPPPPLTDDNDDGVSASPSPSPPPPAPVALTPGPRASRLQQIFSEALLRTLRVNSYANFSSCFPTPAQHVPHSLESVWRQLNAKLEESARAEFDDVLRERDVVRRLNELDRLIGEARLRRENGEVGESVPLHTLGANELYEAHLNPYLTQAQSSLDGKLDDVQKENTRLSETIELQRQEIQQLLSGLETVVRDVEGAVKATAEFDAENQLRQEAEQMDEEIRSGQQP
ncbi:hypothetical protein AJ80_04287 [Polytolypa hystricis UAMH7299]|uniref:MIND kinetochore complex component Nnf1 n=1 Tax=Polytolypa hystricis (strain UAMH7299) TaxID=1447883 RepID=A0A2B7YCN8_POLH7|nr:hypothetical protein AJ80_04287 [Polytolypa hystricis UAMH7299]